MTWVELESVMLIEISSVRETQIPYDFTHVWNLRNKTNGKTRGGKKTREERRTKKQTLHPGEHTDGHQIAILHT